jgi:hypothetical protein
MPSRLPAWLFAVVLGAALAQPPATAAPDPPIGVATDPPAAAAHDFHVTYGRMGVEGAIVQVRLRFFQDDLALALRAFAGDPGVRLAVDPVTDSLVTAYLADRFPVRAGTGGDVSGTDPLPGSIVASGEEVDGAERIWWYVLQYEAAAPIGRVRVDAKVLLELFDDQRNILRIQAFPSGRERTYYLTHGSSVADFAV